MTIGIYIIRNVVNNKCYIGQSQNIETRIREHKYLLRNNKYGNLKIQNAWNKYGEDNFVFEVIEECMIDELDELEIFYIKKYDSHYNGYNNTDGGGGVRGWKHNEEFKQKMSLSNKINPRRPTPEQIERLIHYNKTRDYHHSDETKAKMSEAHRGLTASDEAKRNMSVAQKKCWENADERRKAQSERFKTDNPYTKLSDEKKAEIARKSREANLGKKRSAEACANIGNIHRGSKYMTDGKVNKRVKEADIQKYLDMGFTFGRTKYWCKK
ncbi:MAG: GIY-YIG nuclease family protein [Candidatus Gastranaerophilaceae bacterium]